MKAKMSLSFSAVMLFFYSIINSIQTVLASAYGEGKYGASSNENCSYGQTCSQQAAKGFTDKYAWIFFLILILISLIWLALLLLERRKKQAKNTKKSPPNNL